MSEIAAVLAGESRWHLACGDNRELLRLLPDECIDSVACDPPYELAFMGRKWDASGIAYDVGMWREVLRVLKPGGHLLAFGGTRTYHRMTCAIEDAGFDIRDCLMWCYGSGFPKSHDVSKAAMAGAYTRAADSAPATDAARQWQGWGSAMKPAYEPVVMARKPLRGTIAANVLEWGTGGLNVDGCRIGYDGPVVGTTRVAPRFQGIMNGGVVGGQGGPLRTPPSAGRWPANLILDEQAGAMLDAQSGELPTPASYTRNVLGHSSALHMNRDNGILDMRTSVAGYGDTGGASRFFYCPKASRAEREIGLSAPPGQRANMEPTVKPLDVMRWLVRLVTPPGGIVLDHFTCSGSTGMAAMCEGFRFIGLELRPEAVNVARQRIAYYSIAGTVSGAEPVEEPEPIAGQQCSLFGG